MARASPPSKVQNRNMHISSLDKDQTDTGRLNSQTTTGTLTR